MISMRTNHDCGPVAIANFLELTQNTYPGATYELCLTNHKFPNKNDIKDDLWDSPARHRDVVLDVAGKPVKFVKDLTHQSAPAVVLLRTGILSFHWVVLIAASETGATWHTGVGLAVTSGVGHPPVGKVFKAYSFEGTKDLSIIWDVWLGITNLMLGIA